MCLSKEIVGVPAKLLLLKLYLRQEEVLVGNPRSSHLKLPGVIMLYSL